MTLDVAFYWHHTSRQPQTGLRRNTQQNTTQIQTPWQRFHQTRYFGTQRVKYEPLMIVFTTTVNVCVSSTADEMMFLFHVLWGLGVWECSRNLFYLRFKLRSGNFVLVQFLQMRSWNSGTDSESWWGISAETANQYKLQSD